MEGERGRRRAVVVGAGIGGLATAIALLRDGWSVRVLERAPELTEVGAGISLWPNAVRALDALGLGAQVRRAGGVQVTGADGVRSTVRRLGFPRAPGPRYAGYVAYRLLTPPLAEPPREGSETWGRGERVGVVPLRDGRVYWFAAVGAPPLGDAVGTVPVPEVLRRFGRWHEPIPRVLEAARAAGVPVLAHDVEELPHLDCYARGRIALIGDAAHAMTPNLGQGACQALEDAVELAAALRAEPVPAALARYDAVRRPRARMVARRSRQVGRVAQWSAAPLVALRDGAARVTPASAALRSLRPVLGWEPPGDRPLGGD